MLTLYEALAQLPDTADGIADRMRALDIKGCQDMGGHCPLARWLEREGFEEAIVERRNATAKGYFWVEMPQAAREFVDRFDDGVYLDLVGAS